MRVLVVGDVMLAISSGAASAHFGPRPLCPWSISSGQNFMPGGAANVARNLAALNAPRGLFASWAGTAPRIE